MSEPDTEWFRCIGAALGRQKAEKFEDILCRTPKVAGFSVALDRGHAHEMRVRPPSTARYGSSGAGA